MLLHITDTAYCGTFLLIYWKQWVLLCVFLASKSVENLSSEGGKC